MNRFANAFNSEIISHGYAWWYMDVVSDDGQDSMVLIAMLGSVFSPRYARARLKGVACDPLDYCAINLALNTPKHRRWVMSEYARTQVERGEHALRIGGTHIELGARGMRVDFSELSAPVPRALIGTIELSFDDVLSTSYALDSRAQHFWSPIAPVARAQVTLSSPQIRFSGSAYVDSNWGQCALEDSFERWQWHRSTRDGQTEIVYDVHERGAEVTQRAWLFDTKGAVDIPRRSQAEACVDLGSTRWGMTRSLRSARDVQVRLERTLEDTPFYARSLVGFRRCSEAWHGVHETLSLERFSRRWVRRLLPFKMRHEFQIGAKLVGAARKTWMLAGFGSR